MGDQTALTQVAMVFMIFAFMAFTAYMRIIMYLQVIDAGVENPPERPRISDKLNAYKAFCIDRGKKLTLLYVFATGVIGAVLSWLPLPWLIFR